MSEVTCSAVKEVSQPTMRQQLENAEKRAHETLARMEIAKTQLPAAWLDMTDAQIFEKFGVTFYL